MSKKICIGERGMFVTCLRGKENKSHGEVLGVLKEFQLFKRNNKKTVEEDLKEELKDLKQKNFIVKKTGVPCVFFVSFAKEESMPSKTVEKMVNKARKGDALGLRTTEKLYPVDFSCGVSIEEMVNLFRRKVFQTVPGEKETFSVVCRIWHNTEIDKDQIKKSLASEMPEKYRVNLKDPDVCVLVIVCKFFCGISLCVDYKKNKENNLKEILRGM